MFILSKKINIKKKGKIKYFMIDYIYTVEVFTEVQRSWGKNILKYTTNIKIHIVSSTVKNSNEYIY